MAIACAGVIPLRTAKVRCMTKLVEAALAVALAELEPPPMNLPVEQSGLVVTA